MQITIGYYCPSYWLENKEAHQPVILSTLDHRDSCWNILFQKDVIDMSLKKKNWEK